MCLRVVSMIACFGWSFGCLVVCLRAGGWLIGWLFDCVFVLTFYWLFDWSFDRLIDCLIEWLVVRLSVWLFDRSVVRFVVVLIDCLSDWLFKWSDLVGWWFGSSIACLLCEFSWVSCQLCDGWLDLLWFDWLSSLFVFQWDWLCLWLFDKLFDRFIDRSFD